MNHKAFAVFVSLFSALSVANAQPVFLDMQTLSGEEPCNRCEGVPLPGQIIPSNETVYRIDSDLPELYYSNGLLYSTQDVLPTFLTKELKEVGEDMLTQQNKLHFKMASLGSRSWIVYSLGILDASSIYAKFL